MKKALIGFLICSIIVLVLGFVVLYKFSGDVKLSNVLILKLKEKSE